MATSKIICRRHFLRLASAGTAFALGMFFKKRTPNLSQEQSSKTILKDSFKVYTLGSNPHIPTSKTSRNISGSVLTEVDLSSGKHRQTILPILRGHQVLEANDGLVCIPQKDTGICLVNRTSLKVEHILNAPEGYCYSGHGTIQKDILLLPLCQLNKKHGISTSKNGKLQIVNLKSKTTSITPYDIEPVPHQIQPLHDENYFAISHNCNLNVGKKSAPSSLSIIDFKTGKLIKKIQLPNKENLRNFIALPGNQLMASGYKVVNLNQKGIKRIIDLQQKGKFLKAVSGIEYGIKKLFLPSVTYLIDWKSGDLSPITHKVGNSRGPSSSCYIPSTKKVVETFTNSNSLQIYDTLSKETTHYSGFQLGLHEVCGVTSLPDTTFIVISDALRGLVLFDTKSSLQLQKYDIHFFESNHLLSVKS